MHWKDIGRELGISGEYARLIAIRALAKIRRRAPDLADVLAAAMRIHDRQSPAQLAIDRAPFRKGDGWGGHRERKRAA
jgi:hypothetical protein